MKLIVLRLTGIAFVCAVALALTYALTKEQIFENRHQYALLQLQSVINDSSSEIIELNPKRFEIRKNNLLTGHIIEQVTTAGYNGDIRMWLGISLENKVLGVRVIQHNETPGLGDKLDIKVSDWIRSFDGQSLHSINWLVKKDGGDIDQFSGATITPRAVVESIKQGLMAYQTEQNSGDIDAG